MKLVDAGVLVELPGRSRNRLFVAPGILAAIEGRAIENHTQES